MSQSYNVITLKKSTPLNLGELNNKSFLYSIKFLESLKRSFIKKGVLIVCNQINFINSICYVNLDLYYKTSQTVKYKSSLKKSLTKSKVFEFTALGSQMNKAFLRTKNSLTVVRMQNLNRDIKKQTVIDTYSSYKRYLGVLFARRFNLFVDFIKMTSLFIFKKLDPKSYLYLLSQIFRLLSKKKHSRFLFFLKSLFNTIIKTRQSSIIGIKFIINGKIQGKVRSSSSRILVGQVPVQSVDKDVSFGKVHVYTLYGTFGFKLWVNYL